MARLYDGTPPPPPPQETAQTEGVVARLDGGSADTQRFGQPPLWRKGCAGRELAGIDERSDLLFQLKIERMRRISPQRKEAVEWLMWRIPRLRRGIT